MGKFQTEWSEIIDQYMLMIMYIEQQYVFNIYVHMYYPIVYYTNIQHFIQLK